MSDRFAPVHPGEYLQELLEELDISASKLAKHIGVSPMRISHVLRGERPVSAELALRLGKAFGQSAAYWVNLQAQYELNTAYDSAPPEIESITPVAA